MISDAAAYVFSTRWPPRNNTYFSNDLLKAFAQIDGGRLGRSHEHTSPNKKQAKLSAPSIVNNSGPAIRCLCGLDSQCVTS